MPRLTAIAENGYDQRIFVRGDKAVDYGTVMQVMGELNAAGFRRIGLVTEPPRGESKKQQIDDARIATRCSERRSCRRSLHVTALVAALVVWPYLRPAGRAAARHRARRPLPSPT